MASPTATRSRPRGRSFALSITLTTRTLLTALAPSVLTNSRPNAPSMTTRLVSISDTSKGTSTVAPSGEVSVAVGPSEIDAQPANKAMNAATPSKP